MNPSLRPLLPLAALAALIAACGDPETPPVDDHTPTSFTLEMSGIVRTPPYSFPAGQTVQVRIRYFNAAQEDLDGVEAEHFGGLAFNPASLATAVRRADHHYQFDVTGSATGGTGTMTASFGHNESADEVSLPPVAVTVPAPGGQ
jgi:hypothetical protein